MRNGKFQLEHIGGSSHFAPGLGGTASHWIYPALRFSPELLQSTGLWHRSLGKRVLLPKDAQPSGMLPVEPGSTETSRNESVSDPGLIPECSGTAWGSSQGLLPSTHFPSQFIPGLMDTGWSLWLRSPAADPYGKGGVFRENPVRALRGQKPGLEAQIKGGKLKRPGIC